MATVETSTIPDVKQALVDLLTAVPELVDVAVTYGHPGELLKNRAIWFEGTSDWTQRIGPSPGTVYREETYELEGALYVGVGGDDAKGAEVRAFGLFAVMESILRANLNLTVSGTPTVNVIRALLHPTASTPYFFDEGRAHEIEFAISVFAQLAIS